MFSSFIVTCVRNNDVTSVEDILYDQRISCENDEMIDIVEI